MSTDWFPESRPVPEELSDAGLEDRISVLRGFSVKDHLDDRSLAALINQGPSENTD